MGSPQSADRPAQNGHWFTTTHWSVVLAARNPASPAAALALEKLCQTYRRPLYFFIRRENHGPEDAEDLVQGFLTRMLEKNHLARVQRQEGKFRNFILTLLKNFLRDERDKVRAKKRGGGKVPVFLDGLSEEERYLVEPATDASPDVLFDKCWAQTVLNRAYQQLQDADKDQSFDALKLYLPGAAGPTPSYAETAIRLGLTEAAVTSVINRFRRSYSELIRNEVAQTVDRPDEIDGEIRYLIEIVGR